MNARTVGIAGLLAVMAFASAPRAQATVLTNSQILSQFNAVIFGSFNTSSEVEGRTVVGGNLTSGGTFDFSPGAATTSSFSALSVYGSVTSGGSLNIAGSGVTIGGSNNGTLNMNGGGAAYVGGSNSGAISGATGNVTVGGSNSQTISMAGGSVYLGGTSGGVTANGSVALSINGNTSGNLNLNGGGTVALAGSNYGTISMNGGSVSYTGSRGSMNLNGGATATHVSSLNLTAPTSTLGSFATTFQTPLTQLSTQLNGVAANSTATVVGQTLTFNAHPINGVAVFDMKTSQFSGATTVTLNLDGATSVIINVTVDSCANGVCAFNPTINFNDSSYASVLLWNFVNATNLDFTTEFGGSILAPDAAVSNAAPIDGTLVSASYSGTGELHSHPYTGVLPGGATPAPEPASMALIGTGLAGLAAVRRRRKGN
jgi:choice-of-anchor A domain-containing protein